MSNEQISQEVNDLFIDIIGDLSKASYRLNVLEERSSIVTKKDQEKIGKIISKYNNIYLSMIKEDDQK